MSPKKPAPSKAQASPQAPAETKTTRSFPAPIRVGALPSRKPLRFRIHPDAALRQEMAKDVDITTLANFSFEGEIRPVGRSDFMLEANLTAEVEQPCAITLTPVHSSLRQHVTRRYIDGMVWPDAEEVEMPEDDTTEPLPEEIDLREIALEALALALPDFPRADGVELGEAVFGPEGQEALRDADLRPFSGLAALRDQLTQSIAGVGSDDDQHPAGKGSRE